MDDKITSFMEDGTAQKSIEQIQDEIIEEFSLFDNWMDKYEYLIDLGKKLPLIDPQYRTDEYLIRGCQSQVWLRAERVGDRLQFTADSDALVTSGIISLLIRVLNNQKPEDIANADLYFIDAIGLREHLSMSRSNGLNSMIETLKSLGARWSRGEEG